MSIFRYFDDERYALALIEQGKLRFRPLAAYRTIEDSAVRGDCADGELRYEPKAGLTLNNVDTGETIKLAPGSRFRSSAKAGDIYTYCLSNSLSDEIAAKFQSPFCVEIIDPFRFRNRIMAKVNLRSRLDRARIFGGPVNYRSVEAPPEADWALPERVAFIKPEAFAWQDEYRIVIGKKGAFDIHNLNMTIELAEAAPHSGDLAPLDITVGDLSKITTLHRF